MRILPAEPDVFPPDLWERLDEGSNVLLTPEQNVRWMCVHTRPKQEKATARHLHAMRVPYYLPMSVQEHRTPGGRKVRSVLPLFTSYLFVRGGDHARVEALKTNRLVKIIEVPDQDELQYDLRQVHMMMNSGLPVMPEPTYPVGTQVRIMTGPLRGLTGTVTRREKRDQFVALVHILGCGAAVDLEDWQVEKVA